MYPIFLNVDDRLALVVGGGSVGRRKARALLETGASVRLVALEPRPEEETAPLLDWRQERYGPQHLAGVALVIAAATPEVNRQVVADARARGLWVNSATEPESGDFTMAATLQRGDLAIAVGTGGKVPGLAKAVRDLFDQQLDDAFGDWLDLMAELRPWLQERVADETQRRGLMQQWCQVAWLDRLRREGRELVRAALLAEARALVGSLQEPL